MRRRREDDGPLREVTFRLPAPLLKESERLVAEGEVESLSVLVERALRNELAWLRRRQLRSSYEEGSGD